MPIDGDVLERIGRIEAIISQTVRRDISPLVACAKGSLLEAARSIAEHPAPSVAVITGFFIRHAEPPTAETDGLTGSVHLAAGLKHAGIPARLVTDSPCAGAVRAAAKPVPESIDVHVVPVSEGAVLDLRNELASMARPVTHFVAIERVGPGPDGKPHREHGWDMTEDTAPLHLMFENAVNGNPWTTIGIGDGGNEMGMGNLPYEVVDKHIPNGAIVACTTRCDHLLVCGVSSWGGLGLLAAVALLRPDIRDALLFYMTREWDRRILQSAVYEGPAIDDSRPDRPGKPQMSIDRIPWEQHADLLEEIVALTRQREEEGLSE